MSDPTLQLLRDLDDPAKYARLDNVPAFVPHTRTKRGADGEPVEVRVTTADLHKIARRANAREKDSGTLAIVCLGHRQRDPDAPETEQPPVVGFGRNWSVGTFGPSKKPCLLFSRYVRRGREDEAAGYPFRSVEYYAGRHEITAVCLLKRDPELDLGLTAYGADEPCLIYSREVNYMADPMADPTMPPDPAVPNMPPDPDEGGDQMDAYMRHCASHPYARAHAQKMLQYADEAGAGAAGATDADPGGVLPSGTNGLPAAGSEVEQFQRTLQATRYERELAGLRKRLGESEQRERAAHYERDLTQLLAEGCVFDLAEELAEVKAMTAEQFGRHKNRIVKHYARDITGVPQVPVVGTKPAAGARRPDAPTKDEADAAIAYLREHHCDFETALAAVRKQ